MFAFLLPFLGSVQAFFSSTKVILVTLALLFVAGVYGYIKYQSHTIDNLRKDVANYQVAIASQNAVIDGLKKDIADILKARDDYQAQVNQLSANNKKLKDYLDALHLETSIPNDKDKKVQRQINDDVKKLVRCLELQTGSKLNPNEKLDCN